MPMGGRLPYPPGARTPGAPVAGAMGAGGGVPPSPMPPMPGAGAMGMGQGGALGAGGGVPGGFLPPGRSGLTPEVANREMLIRAMEGGDMQAPIAEPMAESPLTSPMAPGSAPRAFLPPQPPSGRRRAGGV